MPDSRVSRRELLRWLGGTAAAPVFGALAGAQDPAPAAEEPFIDAHFHTVNSRLPGVPSALPGDKIPLAPFDPEKNPDGLKNLAKTVEQELRDAGMGLALCMPRHEVSDKDPLGVKEIEALAEHVSERTLHPIGLVHPERYDRDHLALVEGVLKKGTVKGLKVYLGYLHYGPDHAGYRPYYKLAAQYKTPIILHTGDTYSARAKVKYAHPKLIDEVAVDYPDTRFVLAHFGNPWIMDAAEVVYKNKNVWADLSGILIGDPAAFLEMAKSGSLARTVTRIKQGIEFAEDPEKFMFGSDWPLAPVKLYRSFVEQLFPKKHHAAVFRDTAKAVFKL
jgi:predicted TIM-barrel fold metal-dependent hydrolase